jgi:thiol-disulfide isomerase/thioredoxin
MTEPRPTKESPMPKTSRALALVASAALAWWGTPPAAADGRNLDGQVPPEIALTDGMNGASAATTLASLRGSVVCVKFWLPFCPVCRATLPAFQAIHDRYGRSGVVCLGIVISDVPTIAPYLREKGFTFPNGCDPARANANAYGVTRYPADYLIGIDGRVKASNGFPAHAIEEELRKHRVAEWGEVPPALAAAGEAVEDGDYGEALRIAEPLAKAEGAAQALRDAVARLVAIARRRQDNRFARADAAAQRGAWAEARGELERTLQAFRGTSLEARARERLDALLASRGAGR